MSSFNKNDTLVNPVDPEHLADSLPDDIKDQADRIRDAHYYSTQMGIPPKEAFDLVPQLNQRAFGKDKLHAAPGKLFVEAFKQSLADKPAVMLHGITAYTPGKALGVDPMLDKASLYLESLQDPQVTKRVQSAMQGRLWPIGDERAWWQVEAKYLPEVVNAWAANVADQIPIMLTTLAARMVSTAISKPLSLLAGGGVAAVTAGPDPTDVATAPAAIAISQEVIKHIGSAAPLVGMEAGAFLDAAEAAKWDPDLAEKYARLYGVGSGTIEYAQWLFVLGRYSKITKRAQEEIIRTALTHIGGSAWNGLEEASQTGLQNFLMQKGNAEMKERHPEYEGKQPETWQGAKRSGVIGTGVAFLTGLPGTGMTIAEGARARYAQVKPETKKLLGEPSVREVQAESEKMPYEKPPAQVAPAVPAEGAAAVAPSAPVATGPAAAAEEPILGGPSEIETAEEARRIEQQLQAEAAEEVRPRLYIGNVTARMKGQYAEALGARTEEMRPYTEGGWPTRRTEIAITRGEAEQYMEWLEADLQRRLDNNLIRTYDDMAQANADWGDLKDLRRVLGVTTQIETNIKTARQERTRLRKLLKHIQKLAKQKKINQEKAGDTIQELEKQIAQQEQVIASGGRPWYIVPETEDITSEYPKRATVSRDQGEVGRTEQEIKRLQGELAQAKTAEEAAAIEDQILAQETIALQLQKAQGRAFKVIKSTTESVYGAVEPSRFQESKMTVQEVLRAVMKRGAREAKLGYAAGRRELRAALRMRARAKQRLADAKRIITQYVPQTVDIVYREAIDAIRAEIDPSFRSEKVLRQRESLRQMLKNHPEKLKDIPIGKIREIGKKALNDYTIEELESVAAEITRLKDLGGLRRKLEVAQYERGKQKDLATIQASSVPVTERVMLRAPKIGEELTYEQRAQNLLAQAMNKAAAAYRSVATGMDVFFDQLDGSQKYQGPNYRIFKKTMDQLWSNYLNLRDRTQKEVLDLATQLGMNNGNYERIGVHAALQQEGGRQKLLDTGYTEQQIDEVRLTAEELQVYELMREKLDSLTDAIEDVMHNVYNAPFQRVRNYFSFMTDFEAMTDHEIREMYGDRLVELSAALRKNVEKGFTVTRRGGFQKIRINAMEVFRRHIDNASYLIEMGGEIKRLGEIAATPEYGQAVGSIGQEETRSWIDLLARKGGAQSAKTIPTLDTLRKHVGAGMIGFRLSTALINITPLLDGAGLIGRYVFRGAANVLDPQWRAFLLHNFPELRDRMGGDIEFLGFGNTPIEQAEKIGFWALRKIDGLAASGVLSGAYQKYLDEHGLLLDLDNPNAEAVQYAQRIMRRTQSSAFFKDLPSAFSRGGFTGNKSIDRLLFQFQSFILNRWSLIEHDMVGAGIKGDTTQMMNMFFWLSLAGLAELSLRRFSKELLALVTGDEPEEWGETLPKEWAINTLQNVPFVSQGVSVYNYGDIPVPTLSLAQDITQKIEVLRRSKNPDKKLIKALELAVLTAGMVTGVPGTGQAAELIRSVDKQQSGKKVKPHF